jgi:Putative zinc-finger
MKNAAHQYEDKLLEFAYGELAPHEADAVDAHVRGCARCADALGEIRAVRSTMSALPIEPAPEAGLESLMAYATQAAERNAKAAAPPSIWKRFLTPLVSIMALATVGVIAFRANQEFDTSPASAAADRSLAEVAQQKEKSKESAPAPVVAAVAPPPTTPAPDVEAPKERQENGQGQANLDELNTALAGKAAKSDLQKNDVWQQPAAPQSASRRDLSRKSSTAQPTEDLRQDFINARGGLGGDAKIANDAPGRAKDATPPPPPKVEATPIEQPVQQDKALSFGLGSGASTGSTGGSGFADVGGAKTPPADLKKAEKPNTVLETKAKKTVAATEEYEAGPAPTAAPSTPVAVAPKPAPQKMPAAKGSYQLSPLSSSSTPRGGAAYDDADQVALEKSDAKGVDDEAKFNERRNAALRTQSLEQARVASNSGNRTGEIQLLLKVLQTGAIGYEKAEALKRLCDAFEALGEADRADPYCDKLLREFPNTVAAKVVTQRRNASQRMAPSPSKSQAPSISDRERKALEVDDAKKTEPASAPTQAY